MNENKSPIKSKTIITNTAVLGLLPLFEAFGIDVPQELVLSLLPLINILLRLVTKGGVSSNA